MILTNKPIASDKVADFAFYEVECLLLFIEMIFFSYKPLYICTRQ